MQLRDYQVAACEAIEEDWLYNKHRSVMVEMPTGTGKTVIFVHAALRFGAEKRTLVICPMTILVAQAAKKFLEITDQEADIEQAALWANETDFGKSQFVVASKQTLCKERRDGTFRYQRFKDIGLVVVDECDCHMGAPVKRMLDWFIERGACVLGVTATGRRHDGVALGNYFEKCSFQYGIVDAIDDGWLVGCKTSCVRIQSMDLSDVSVTAGDFAKGELNEILEQEKVILEIADVAVRESRDMKTAIYCSSVKEAQGVSEIISKRYGKKAAFVCADTKLCSEEDRQSIIRDFTVGELQFVANVGILSRGWDFPGLEHIVQAQPTKSLTRYAQIFGRCTRPLPGIVDFEGSTAASRRASIGNSAKPFFHMTDLVDNSLVHKICSCADVLGGKMGIEIIERAKKDVAAGTAAGGAPAVMQTALAEAAKSIERERQEAEAKRREHIKARVQYQLEEVNPFDTYQRGANTPRPARQVSMLFGKFKGQPVKNVPTTYLRWMLRECRLKDWYKNALMHEIELRSPTKQKV